MNKFSFFRATEIECCSFVKDYKIGIKSTNPAGIYLLKVNNENTGTRCEICSKLTGCRSGVFFVNFEHISHLVLVFLLLTLNM